MTLGPMYVLQWHLGPMGLAQKGAGPECFRQHHDSLDIVGRVQRHVPAFYL